MDHVYVINVTLTYKIYNLTEDKNTYVTIK